MTNKNTGCELIETFYRQAHVSLQYLKIPSIDFELKKKLIKIIL